MGCVDSGAWCREQPKILGPLSQGKDLFLVWHQPGIMQELLEILGVRRRGLYFEKYSGESVKQEKQQPQE